MPTDISFARGSAYSEDELRAPPREGQRRARAPRKRASPLSRLAAAAPFRRLSTGAVIGCAAFCALMTGVVVNALYLQTDKHAAPMFPPEATASAPANVRRVAARPVEAPAPAPRPAAAPDPEFAPPLPAPRPPQRDITGSLGRQTDGLDALIAGASVKPAPKPAPKKPAAAPARSQPTQAVAEHRRAAAAKPKAVAAKPAADKPQAAHKPAVAAAKDQRNSAAVTTAISDEMRRKLASIGGAPAKAKAAKAAADDEE